MKKGYSYATVQRNIADLLASGMERSNAISASKSAARLSFFKRFPAGAIPVFLAFPANARLAQYYDQRGKPLRTNPQRRDIKQASKLIQDFSGHKAKIYGKIKVKDFPKVAIAIGDVLGISYETKRDGVMEKYYHRFTRKQARPLLVSSQDGKQLYLIGGSYDFTELGIVDRK